MKSRAKDEKLENKKWRKKTIISTESDKNGLWGYVIIMARKKDRKDDFTKFIASIVVPQNHKSGKILWFRPHG